MSKKFWTTSRFKRLQSIWESRLKDAGFVDIENEHGKLKQNSGNSYRTTVQTVIENKLRYYELLSQGHHEEHEFKDDVERLVMERRSHGVSYRSISLELQSMGERYHRETIRRIIRRYERKWGIRKVK